MPLRACILESHRLDGATQGPKSIASRVLARYTSVRKTRGRLGYKAPLSFKFSFTKDKAHEYLNPQVKEKRSFPRFRRGQGMDSLHVKRRHSKRLFISSLRPRITSDSWNKPWRAVNKLLSLIIRYTPLIVHYTSIILCHQTSGLKIRKDLRVESVII